jgi:hypothetical protein
MTTTSRWAAHVVRVRAVRGYAVHVLHALDAELRPAGATLRADAAAVIVVLHYALTDSRLPLRYTSPHCDDDAARLVPGNYRASTAEPQRRRCLTGRGAVKLEIATAKTGGLDLETTSPSPGDGSGNSCNVSFRSPVKTTPCIVVLPLGKWCHLGWLYPSFSTLA